jgi:hypothetical protein
MLDFRKSHLAQSELVRWLADLIYPGMTRSFPRNKRIRMHLDRAKKKGLIRTKKSEKNILIHTQSFLRWVSRKKARGLDWGKSLQHKHPELYVPNTIVTVSGVETKGMVGYPSVGPLPLDLESAHQEILRLRSQNTQLKNEIARHRKKEEERQQYLEGQRKHGKTGGRGKEK